ncbi:hypothetical protein J6590_067633 [Homalodisca vitripennis]|nr:hypothetical protein J6590_067633 [Homalodisca vitripennis]
MAGTGPPLVTSIVDNLPYRLQECLLRSSMESRRQDMAGTGPPLVTSIVDNLPYRLQECLLRSSMESRRQDMAGTGPPLVTSASEWLRVYHIQSGCRLPTAISYSFNTVADGLSIHLSSGCRLPTAISYSLNTVADGLSIHLSSGCRLPTAISYSFNTVADGLSIHLSSGCCLPTAINSLNTVADSLSIHLSVHCNGFVHLFAFGYELNVPRDCTYHGADQNSRMSDKPEVTNSFPSKVIAMGDLRAQVWALHLTQGLVQSRVPF